MKANHVFRAALGAAVVSLAAPGTAHAGGHKAICVGITTVDPPINYTSSERGGATVEDFDFTGVHDLCLADATVVAAPMAGHITRVVNDDGTGHLVVHETITIPNGTLDGTVRAWFSPTTFDAKVHAFGGTGVLSGVSGHGTTMPTGPDSFRSHIEYKYR